MVYMIIFNIWCLLNQVSIHKLNLKTGYVHNLQPTAPGALMSPAEIWEPNLKQLLGRGSEEKYQMNGTSSQID